jgi:CRP/FNR family transcriptional regulator
MHTGDALLESLDAFPELRTIRDEPWLRAVRGAQIVDLQSGGSDIGDSHFCLLLEGSLRIRIVSDSGHEISLCRARPGGACWFNVYSLLADVAVPLEFDVVVESSARVMAIPKARFMEALNASPDLRAAVFAALTAGITELISLVDDLRFGPLNRRVAQWLLMKSEQHSRIQTTHNSLALELGTAREVVSRLLKDFERSGWVKLHRGHIDVLNKSGLRYLTLNQVN